jgi:muramidase (phage lysozyme)
MHSSVPAGAALLLDFIADFESNGDYNVIYGNNEDKLPAPITTMTLNALLEAQPAWGARWGSSAAGRYQFMPPTLRGLMQKMQLSGDAGFTPGMQDKLAYQLLKGRGYARFKSGALALDAFGKQLAMEWASLPVLSPTKGAHRMLERGETYYAGDRLNRALVKPERVEALLHQVAAAAS